MRSERLAGLDRRPPALLSHQRRECLGHVGTRLDLVVLARQRPASQPSPRPGTRSNRCADYGPGSTHWQASAGARMTGIRLCARGAAQLSDTSPAAARAARRALRLDYPEVPDLQQAAGER